MEDDNLESFYFNETINGVEHAYRITMKDKSYGVELDGLVIAEIALNERWEQISGNPLSPDLIERLGDKIEAHYS